MKQLYRNEKGFTVVEGLLIILILTVIGFGGYYVWHSQKDKNTNNAAASTSTKAASSTNNVAAANPYAGWKSYCSSIGQICYKYPANWSFKSNFYTSSQGPSPESDVITSPSGNVKAVYNVEQIGGTGTNATINVLDAKPVGDSFQQVALVLHDTDTTNLPDDYSASVFLASNTMTEGSTSNPFKAGDSYSIQYGSNLFKFKASSTSTNASSFYVNGNFQTNSDGSNSEDAFASLADAQNWYKSSEVQTAVLILRSVTVSN